MFHLRRAALRALSAAPSSTLRVSSRASPALSSQTVQRPLISSKFAQLRLYATEPTPEQRTQEQEAQSSLSTSAEATESQHEEPSSTLDSAAESVKRTASQAADAAQSAFRSAKETVSGARDAEDSFPSPMSGDKAQPSQTLYVGNLYFEVREEAIKREFEKFGEVESVTVITDGRGLSKGFAYVKFTDTQSAAEARSALNYQVLEGRRMAVNYAVKKSRTREPRAPYVPGERRNPPSRSLFIGNLSYEMTDRDLNDLFREIKNVTDVRVAIDRRTGQPRGFAHADFLDVASAEKAASLLESREFYGRSLRIDFTDARPVSRNREQQEPSSATSPSSSFE